MATTPFDEIALVDLPTGTDRSGFHQEVADRIIDVWQRRDSRIRSGQEPGPGPSLLAVAEMTARIGTAYDALVPWPAGANAASEDNAGAEGEEAALRPSHSDARGDALCTENAGRRIALWVVAVGDLGGVARHVLDAARVGIPGWRMFVLCPEGPLAERLRAQGAAVLTAAISPSDPLDAGVRAVRHTVRTLRPAVVHSHLAYSDFLVAGATLGLLRGGPPRLVTTEHGIAGNDLVYHGTRAKSRVMEAAHAARLRRFDALIAVADATLAAVRAKWHPPRSLKTVVIPNGVDTPTVVPPPTPGRFHIISLSRLAPEKGLPDLLEAFALVHAAHAEARLTLAGEGPLRGELEAQIARLGLVDAVTMPGFVDAEALLAHADVLAQLSLWENCSYSLLDAAARSLAITASEVGGNRTLLVAHQIKLRSRPVPQKSSSAG